LLVAGNPADGNLVLKDICGNCGSYVGTGGYKLRENFARYLKQLEQFIVRRFGIVSVSYHW